MFNCIESSALMDLCRAVGLVPYVINSATTIMDDIYIIAVGSIEKCQPEMPNMPNYRTCEAFKLSEYLLATTPVVIKEAHNG